MTNETFMEKKSEKRKKKSINKKIIMNNNKIIIMTASQNVHTKSVLDLSTCMSVR